MRRILGSVLAALLLAPLAAGPARRTVPFVHLADCCCDATTPPDKCCCRTGERAPGGVEGIGKSCRFPLGSPEAARDGTDTKALLSWHEDSSPAPRAAAAPEVRPGPPGSPWLCAPDHVPLLPA
ncbi:MAG TPA: hypothetical protein VL084_03055 [Thermoanaerobaculia bacterium]|nr:hypothetical protein [Thermoanaerobaculia bacterium]